MEDRIWCLYTESQDVYVADSGDIQHFSAHTGSDSGHTESRMLQISLAT